MAASDTVLTAHGRVVATRSGAGGRALDVIWYLALTLMALLFVFPFFWAVSSSLKAVQELFVLPPLLFPTVPRWENYLLVLRKVPFLTWFGNSVMVVTLSTAGIIL